MRGNPFRKRRQYPLIAATSIEGREAEARDCQKQNGILVYMENNKNSQDIVRKKEQ